MALSGFPRVSWGLREQQHSVGQGLVPGLQAALALLWPLGTALPPAPRCHYCTTRPEEITLEKLELGPAPIPAISRFLFPRNAALNADGVLQAHVELGCLGRIPIGSFIP